MKGYNTVNKHEQLQRSSAEVFSNVSTDASKTNVNNHGYPGNTKNVQVLCPCIFCHNNHYNDECDKYSTVTERKKVLSQQKRCFICLKTGLMLKQCPSLHKIACCHCGKRNSHNRCLCPEKFAAQRAESFVVTGQDHNSDVPVTIDLSTAQSSTQLQQLETNITTDLTQSLLASGEKVMLQTAIVLIQSSDGKLVKARILLDSASQRTFMTNQLAQKLKLSLSHKEHLSVSTFGAQKATIRK